jgi:hypothetical protein
VSVRRRPGRRCSCPSSFLRNVLFFSSFFLTAAGDTNGEEPPKITLERIVDGRGNRVCDLAKVSVKSESGRRSVWLVRGLVRSDLILRHDVRPGADGKEVTADDIRLGAGAPLRFVVSGSGGRIAASSPVSTFLYFDQDVSRKTVRCNLSRLVEETDHDLLPAAAEYIRQGLEDDGLAPEELPVLALLSVEKRPPRPSLPIRRKAPLPEDAPEAAELKAAALAALGEE